jgi:hypothetical protein
MSAEQHTPTSVGSQGLREVYRWSTADKRAPNLVGKPCVLMSEDLYDELVQAAKTHLAARNIAARADAADRLRAAIARATGSAS